MLRFRHLRVGAVLAATMAASSVASAGPLFLAGAQYGASTRQSVSAGVLIPVGPQPELDIQPSVTHSGVLIDGAVGAGGTRLALGFGAHMTEAVLLSYGIDFCATVTRTSGSPRGATPHSTYAGAAAGLTLSLIRLTGGVEHRVAGASGSKATVFTWSVGVQIPFGR